MSKISRNIKKLRTANKMTQEDLAAKIHVTRQTVSSWETDRTQPDLDILKSLAEIFGVEAEEIIYGKKKNTAEEKEKLLFGNALITVLSVLGCLLIGAGVVMIFIKWWNDFPYVLKLITCFIPALAGQGFGFYTYIKKRESQAWCEGASVLWMLGVGVTTAIVISQVSYISVSDSLVFFVLAASFLVLMTVFKTISPLAVVHSCGLICMAQLFDDSVYYYLDLEDGAGEFLKFVIIVATEALFLGCTLFVSKKLCRKEGNIIRYTFTQWLNFAAMTAFICLTLSRTEITDAFISLIALAAIVFFAVGQKNKDSFSPYRVLGLPVSAAALCLFSVLSGLDSGTGKGASIFVLVLGLLPLALFIYEKARPESVYMRVYGVLATSGLFIFNFWDVMIAFRNPDYYKAEFLGTFETYDFFLDALLSLNFPICLAGLIMLVVYGAKERKLLYLNLGFILSCVSVISKLYLLDLGLIVTGIMLIVCGAALLFVNLKISRLREKEKAASLREGEEELQ